MAFNFLFNRLDTNPLNKINTTIEAQIIRQIAQENKFLFNNTAFKNPITETSIKVAYTVHKVPLQTTYKIIKDGLSLHI
jgi:hypothetical protein